jgi:hypothetical protein
VALDKFRSSPLPNPPAAYDAQYMRQFLRVLENYFSQLDSNTPNHAEKYTASTFVGGTFTGTGLVVDTVTAQVAEVAALSFGYGEADALRVAALIAGGIRNGRMVSDDIMAGSVYANEFFGNGQHISVPYNQFQSDVTQTAPDIATANVLTMNINDYPDGISLVSGSRITVAHAGVYEIAFSVQLQSTSTSTELVDIWFRKNGVDVPACNSQFSLPARKSAGVPSSLIAVTPFIIPLAANDYVQIMWRVTDVAVTVKALPAVTASPGVTPAIPATPSVLVTTRFVSAKFPVTTYVAPLPVFGFGRVGDVTVRTT